MMHTAAICVMKDTTLALVSVSCVVKLRGAQRACVTSLVVPSARLATIAVGNCARTAEII